MNKTLIKSLFSLALLITFALTPAIAQTITIGSVDVGPYAPGSSIAVPVHINYAGNCIPTNNTFKLYFSNASGVYSATPITTVTGFYITFMNFKIPATSTAGTGYKVKITSSSNPGATVVESAAFSVTTGTGVTAGITAPYLNGNMGVFGNCNGIVNYKFDFQDASDPLKSSVTFFNEKTQTVQATTPTAANGTFTADQTNYTVIVKAVNNGIVGTMAYPLINNPVNNAFAVANSSAFCLSNGVATVPFKIPILTVQDNFPGDTYIIDWGDSSPKSVYTFCNIQASVGQVSHVYTTTSCGQPQNAFPVTCQPANSYCTSLVSPVGSSAKVVNIPTNKFTSPTTGCTNTEQQFTNNSDPGSDPSKPNCINVTASYTWMVLNNSGTLVFQQQNVPIDQPFKYTFTTAGTYTVELELQNNSSACPAVPVSHTICIQDNPVPVFHLTSSTVCIADQPIVPVNTSTVPPNSCFVNQYQWSVTPSIGVTFNAASANPQFTFSNPGVYQIGLTISTPTCGPVSAPSQTLTVNSSPLAQLSKDFSACGNNQILKFNNNATNNPTYTVLSGTATDQPDTYTWAVSGGAYSFATGFTANSKYPNIIFNDYAVYTVTVTQKNNCGSITSTQHITFQQAPTVDAGSDFPMCATETAQLKGQVSGTGITGYKWVNGTGTFTPNANTLNATYKPSTAEISAGTVTLTLQATTAVAAPCDLISSSVTITIAPVDVINSPLTKSFCSGTKINYQATSPDANATFTWTAKVVSGSATGFSPTGNTSLISDVLTNTDPTGSTNAVVTYTITPVNSLGCPGTPSVVNITVTPLPVITATPVNASICSSQPANITLASKLSGTKYLWTSTAPAGVTGNTKTLIAADVTGIQDILINNGSAPATVTYTITPISSTGCTGAPVQASVIVNPAPIVANAGSDFPVCDLTSVQMKGNSPSPGTGKWTVEPSAGVIFSDATSPTSGVSGLAPGTTYKFTWTITYYGCSSSNSINVSVFAPTLAGTTSTADQSVVCAGNNSGKIVLNNQLGTIENWQTSTDNGVTWAPVTPVNNTASLSYLNLTQTTIYQAIVKNGSCTIGYSSPTTITVNQPAVTAYAGPPASLCNVTTYTMKANDPGNFQGTWTQLTGPPATIDFPTKYNTTISSLQQGNVYSFQWTIQAVSPCSSSSDQVVVTDASDVTASFTPDKIDFCGEQNVTFTNTSNNQNGASFLWDFGDGSPSSSDVNPQHVFTEDPLGKDKIYTVTLSVLKNCAIHPAATKQIIVRPATPDAHIDPSPLSGCGPTLFTIKNRSNGDNDTYTFYVKDAQGNDKITPIIKTDKSDVTFTLTSNIDANYTFYMTATNNCDNKNTSPIVVIPMAPQDIAAVISTQDNLIDCFPFTATLINASGGTSYYYNVTQPDGSIIKIPAVSGPQPYSFPKPGNYSIQLFASDACSPSVPSATILHYTIYAPPAPDFTPTIDCTNVATFVNNTLDPNNLFSYSWDFGDGSAPSPNPTHQYVYDAQHNDYKVTLTATNTATKCFSSITHDVMVSPLLTAGFEPLPGPSISIPDYHFNFVDKSTGSPTSWLWDFGDGTTSTSQNPGHSYAYGSAGDHIVTLTVTRPTCPPSTVSHTVTITGIPGQLYLPNAFIPNGSTEALKVFMAKGAGIKTWLLQIFNNYGQLVWQTTKLDSNGSPVEGWDGTFKGTPAPQGAYTWQASATFINGSDWKGMSYSNSLPKRTGTVNLIR